MTRPTDAKPRTYPPATPATPEQIAEYEALPTDVDREYASAVAFGFALRLQEMKAEYEAAERKQAAA